MWWIEELEELRNEQKPKMEQPCLRIPLCQDRWEPEIKPQQPQEIPEHGYCILDM